MDMESPQPVEPEPEMDIGADDEQPGDKETEAETETSSTFKLLDENGLQEVLSSSGYQPDPKLNQGETLPKFLVKDFNCTTMACIPLREIDPAYEHQQTFVALGRQGTIHRYSAKDALFVLSPLNPVRKAAIFISTHWLFSAFMVVVVISNTIVLASGMRDGYDYASIAIYALEFIIKVLSRGLFIDSFTTLQDPWSWLDIGVIYLAIRRALGYHSVFHWIRLLKVIPLVDGIKKAFHHVILSSLKLLEATFLSCLSIIVFGLIGLHLYMGKLTQKCVKNVGYIDATLSPDQVSMMWDKYNRNESNWFGNPPEYFLCGNATSARHCPENFSCMRGYGNNPDRGYTSYDSFAWSILATVRLIHQDTTASLLDKISQVCGVYDVVYFVLIFFCGTYALGTFFYAVIGEYFFKNMEKNLDEGDTDSGIGVANCVEKIPHRKNKLMEDGDKADFRSGLKTVADHLVFDSMITIIIIVDILFLSLNHHAFPSVFKRIREYGSWFILGLYFTEFLLKLAAYGGKGYFEKWWNRFDFAILLHFFTGLFIESKLLSNPIRMFKIVPRWSTARNIFLMAYETVKCLWGFAFTSILFWAFFALVGKEGFAGMYLSNKSQFPEEALPRWNLVDYPHSFLTVFRSWAGETLEPMYACLLTNGWSCFIYFPIIALSGTLLIMTLIVGIVYVTVKVLAKLESQDPSSTLSKLFGMCCPCIIQGQPKGQKVDDVNNIEDAPSKGMDEESKGSKYKPTFDGAETLQEKLQIISGHVAFRGTFVLLIILTSILMAFGNVHHKEHYNLNIIIYSFDIAFTCIFTIEIGFKIVANGVMGCFKSPAWMLDFFVVLELYFHLIFNFYEVVGYHYAIFHFIRSLRPLMLISRIYRIKVVLQGIRREMRFLWKYFTVGIFIWLYFDIYGNNLFEDAYFKCIRSSDRSPVNESTVWVQYDCEQDTTWSVAKSYWNFDNIAEGFVSLSLVAFRNGWIEILQDGFDTYKNGVKGMKEHTLENFYFFLAFLSFGVFFMLSILFGVLYYNLKDGKFAKVFLTPEQHSEYKELKRNFGEPWVTKSPENGIRAKLNDTVSNSEFDALVMFLIVVDNILLALYCYESSHRMNEVLTMIRLCILLLFVIEMLMKLVAWDVQYFERNWERLDFMIVIFSLLDLVLFLFELPFVNMKIIRALRILRILQFQPLISRSKFIRAYFNAFLAIRPAQLNILCFQTILMYSYCLFGMLVFGNLKERWAINSTTNFQTFRSSAKILFTISSMSGIDKILAGLATDTECQNADSGTKAVGNCGNGILGLFFVYSYLLLSFLNMLNLYMILLLEITHRIQLEDEGLSDVEPETCPIEEEEDNEGVESPKPDMEEVVEEEEAIAE